MKRHEATFVSPSVAPESVLVTERERRETMHSVRAQLAQNLYAGFGASTVIAATWFALFKLAGFTPSPVDVATWSAIGGAVTFGLLMFARNALDEIYDGWDIARMVSDLESKDTDNAALLDRVEELTNENRRLRAELIAMTQQRTAPHAKYTSATSEDERACADAKTIIERVFRGLPWSRETMKSNGWTQTQWENARDICVAAKVLSYAGKNPIVVPASYELACSLLETYRFELAKKASLATNNAPTTRVTTTNNDDQGRAEV